MTAPPVIKWTRRLTESLRRRTIRQHANRRQIGHLLALTDAVYVCESTTAFGRRGG